MRRAINAIDPGQVETLLDTLMHVKRDGRKALVLGAGRSGLVGKAFAIRLMHVGIDVYVMGETITPAIGEGDIVIIISGSGSGAMSTTAAHMAKRLGSLIFAVTSYPDSELAARAHAQIRIALSPLFSMQKSSLHPGGRIEIRTISRSVINYSYTMGKAISAHLCVKGATPKTRQG